MHKMLSLFRANAGRGAGMAVRAMGDEPEMLIYDFIVSSDDEAGWLGGVSAEGFVRALRGMTAPRVHIRINSPGGDAFAGIAMANAIRAYPGDVVVHVDGFAASAAGLVTTAAPTVLMGKGAMIMVHRSWTFAMGNSADMLATAALLEKLDGQQVALLSEKSPDYDWDAALAAETWFTADEAMAAGLASGMDEPAKGKAKALAFDLSAYDRAPAAVVEAAANDDMEQTERRRRVARLAAIKG